MTGWFFVLLIISLVILGLISFIEVRFPRTKRCKKCNTKAKLRFIASPNAFIEPLIQYDVLGYFVIKWYECVPCKILFNQYRENKDFWR
jgi:hypothetical protein